MTKPPPAVLVAIPSVDWVWSQAVSALLGLLLPPGSAIMHSVGFTTLVNKRNCLAQEFARDGRFGALLFLDSDMVPPTDTVGRLLGHDLPIVGPLMFGRVPPYGACAGHGDTGRITEFGGPDPVQRVDWLGTGCMLIQRDALLRIPQPWFAYPEDKPNSAEDLFFCRQAAKAGVPIHIDTSFCVGHLGVTSVDLDFVMAHRQTAGERERVSAVHRANEELGQHAVAPARS